MYVPEHFREGDEERVRALVAAHPLATLVVQTDDGLVANHLPMLWQEAELIGHVALANELHRTALQGQEVLAVFSGDSAYVSPNWYPSKQQHHRHVPTWNYSVVHIYGTLNFSHDPRTKRSVVARLTRHHEQRLHGDGAWRMADAPPDYLDDMLDGIVAFTLQVSRINAKAKLSQNRATEDRDGATQALDALGQHRIAAAMRQAASDPD